jgi:hypothetical protein
MLVLEIEEVSKTFYTHPLYCLGYDLEIGRDITTKNSSFQSFHVSSNISLRSQDVTFVGGPMCVLMPVRHDDITLISFNLI